MQHTGLARIVVSTWLTVSLSMLLAACQPQTPVQPTETVIIATAKPPATTTPFITIIIPPTTTAMPPVTIATTPPTPTKTQETPMPVETTIKITAAELYAAYVADPIAADALYKGKAVEVTGVVTGSDAIPRPSHMFILMGKVKVELDPVSKYDVPGVTPPMSGMQLYAYVSSLGHINFPLTITAHVVGFDTYVNLIP